ncbi:MAG: hypothetical protein KH295_11435 [Clostridiaceae bacterium]|nr:hypothetical protein [Clostridiaceae bacterium]
MLQMIQHMIAGILASATIVGGGGVTVTEIVTPPGSVDPQNPPGLAEFIEMVPDAARIDCSVIQNRTGGEDGLVPDGPYWNESFSLAAYDADGNLIGSMSGSGAFPDITLYEYDADGNRTRVTEYRGDEVISESVYTYDAQGCTASYASYQDGELEYTYEYTYAPQADGTLLCTVTTLRADGTTSEDSHVTDAAGNPVHTEMQLADKTITTDITYDEKGRATLVVYDYGAAVPSETRYTYTDAADGSYTCTVELYDNGELLSRTEQKYDAFGILMHEEERNPDGELLREVTVHTLEP